MLTDLSTDTFYTFTEGKADIVGDQTVVPGGDVQIYLPTVMSHIEETTDKVTYDVVNLNIINRFANKESVQIPKRIKLKNSITATISEDKVIEISNKKAKEKYDEEEYPQPIYYIERSAKLTGGEQVKVLSNIGSIKDMYIK